LSPAYATTAESSRIPIPAPSKLINFRMIFLLHLGVDDSNGHITTRSRASKTRGWRVVSPVATPDFRQIIKDLSERFPILTCETPGFLMLFLVIRLMPYVSFKGGMIRQYCCPLVWRGIDTT
jgi:hypothetical protein